MTVYVDYPLQWATIKEAPRVKYWCHMMADSVDELHDMAAKIGMKREWFQISRSGIPHYDLTFSRRELAMRNGAQDFNDNSTTWCLEFLKGIRINALHNL